MKEFNIGMVVQKYRKQKQLTQEELASVMGVSKSSVSKWETGQTYPDIYLLPELATYFNITIDELMGYERKLTKYEIRDIYVELSERFGNENFDIVFEDYQKLVKKYYSSEPFLLQMAVLLLNYASLTDSEKHPMILEYIINLTKRVKEESLESHLITQANVLEAFCMLQLGYVEETLELLNHDVVVYLGQEQLLSKAYAMKGDIIKAQEVLQATEYQHLIGLIIISGDNLTLEIENQEKFDEIVNRIMGISQIYKIRELHPFLLMTFLNNVFLGYTEQNRIDKALEVMEEITDLMIAQQFPVELHGDDYFYLLDKWMLSQPSINTNMPRDEKTVKLSLIQFYEEHVKLKEVYQKNERYLEFITKLKKNCGD